MYYLFAEDDSSVFRVVRSQPASDDDTTPNGIMVRTISNGSSSLSAVWKNITIRANKLTWYPPIDEPPIPKLVVMNVDGSGVREVTGPPEGFTHISSPEWSADGKRLYFSARQIDQI